MRKIWLYKALKSLFIYVQHKRFVQSSLSALILMTTVQAVYLLVICLDLYSFRDNLRKRKKNIDS